MSFGKKQFSIQLLCKLIWSVYIRKYVPDIRQFSGYKCVDLLYRVALVKKKKQFSIYKSLASTFGQIISENMYQLSGNFSGFKILASAQAQTDNALYLLPCFLCVTLFYFLSPQK